VVAGDAARALSDRPREHVAAVGPVEDVRPQLRAAALAVAPLRFGGGSNVRVLEAMALGRPVVATSVAINGIDAVSGRELFVADDAAGLAAATLRVLGDRELATQLGRSGRDLIERRYDWDLIAAQLDRFLRGLVAPHRLYRLAFGKERVG
jgi:polysaccharide biosynthesis protein PslH